MKDQEVVKKLLRFGVPMAAGAVFALSASQARAQEDLSISGGVTVVGQALSDVDFATNGAADPESRGDGTGVTYSIDLAFEKEMESGTAFIYLIGAQGDAVYGGANADAEQAAFMTTSTDGAWPTVGVAEAWYAHNMFDEMMTFKIGKIDPTANYDANEGANDQTTQFLADGLVNNRAILFPAYPYTPGMNLSFAFGDVVSLQFGVFEDTGTELPGEFEGKFVIGELGLHYELFDNNGNLRTQLWNSSYGAEGITSRNGVAFNLDQGFGDEFMTLFMRLGFQFGAPVNTAELEPEETLQTEISTAFSIGSIFNFGDGHSFGFGYELTTTQAEEIEVDSVLVEPSARHWVETFIDFAVTEDFHFAADLQAVINPDFYDGNDALWIPGIRFQASF